MSIDLLTHHPYAYNSTWNSDTDILAPQPPKSSETKKSNPFKESNGKPVVLHKGGFYYAEDSTSSNPKFSYDKYHKSEVEDSSYSSAKAVSRQEMKPDKVDEADIQSFIDSFFWNEKFQVLLERPTFTPQEAQQRTIDIRNFTQEFIEGAKPIVLQIVKELWKEDSDKTVKPVTVGGVAGGEKYMYKDLFLKFAKDHYEIQLYGGDEWAQKAAFHELTSLTALISCGVPNLHFPMMCIMTCYGHCIVVVSKLPINKNTHVYGSANAAQIIKTDNFEMEKMLKIVAQKLNLKPHYVRETSTKQLKLVYGPVDIEGHQGLDGRYYVVDTARLFPPSTPIRLVKGCHLYKLLRPELVRSNPLPLSSDAFAAFGKPDEQIHNEEVRAATNRILEDIIPNKLANSRELLDRDIKEVMHAHGVNMRFLGVVYVLSKNRNHIKYSPQLHHKLLVEIAARAFKAVLFAKMRKILRDIETKCLDIARESVSYLFAKTKAGNDFWKSLRSAAKTRFIFHPGTEAKDKNQLLEIAENSLESNWRLELIDSSNAQALFERAATLTGVRFKVEIVKEVKENNKFFASRNHSDSVFKPDELVSIDILVKSIEVIPFWEVMKGNFAQAEQFYLEELKNRQNLLGPKHIHCASTHLHLSDLYSERGLKEQALTHCVAALNILNSQATVDPREIAEVREKKADLHMKFDEPTQAESELNEILKLREKFGTQNEPLSIKEKLAIATIKDKLARVYTKLQKYNEAQKLFEEVITLKTNCLGPQHWQVARSKNNLAQVLFAKRLFKEAEPLCLDVLNILITQRGPEHSEVGIAKDNLAKVYAATNRRKEADVLLREALAIKEKTFGSNHSYVGMTLDHIASNLLAMLSDSQNNIDREKIFQECKSYYERAVAIFGAAYGEKHSALGITNNNLGLLHLKQNKLADALHYFEDAYSILSKTLGPNSPQTKATLNNLNSVKSKLAQESARQVSVTGHMVKDEDFISHEGDMPTMTSEKFERIEDQKIDENMIQLLKKLNIDVSKLKDRQSAAKILNDLNEIISQIPTRSQQPPHPPQKPVSADDYDYETQLSSGIVKKEMEYEEESDQSILREESRPTPSLADKSETTEDKYVNKKQKMSREKHKLTLATMEPRKSETEQRIGGKESISKSTTDSTVWHSAAISPQAADQRRLPSEVETRRRSPDILKTEKLKNEKDAKKTMTRKDDQPAPSRSIERPKTKSTGFTLGKIFEPFKFRSTGAKSKNTKALSEDKSAKKKERREQPETALSETAEFKTSLPPSSPLSSAAPKQSALHQEVVAAAPTPLAPPPPLPLPLPASSTLAPRALSMVQAQQELEPRQLKNEQMLRKRSSAPRVPTEQLQNITPEDLLKLKEKLVETLSSAPQTEAIVEETGALQFGWTQM